MKIITISRSQNQIQNQYPTWGYKHQKQLEEACLMFSGILFHSFVVETEKVGPL